MGIAVVFLPICFGLLPGTVILDSMVGFLDSNGMTTLLELNTYWIEASYLKHCFFKYFGGAQNHFTSTMTVWMDGNYFFKLDADPKMCMIWNEICEHNFSRNPVVEVA